MVLFDCLTCDKCIPICPNDANFSFVIPIGTVLIGKLVPGEAGWTVDVIGALSFFTRARQIGTFADVCNECGHCDVLCPEDGGPYLVKPLFFGSLEAWKAAPHRDGFALEQGPDGITVHGRFGGRTVNHAARRRRGSIQRRTASTSRSEPKDVAATVKGTADGPVDLTWLHIMDQIATAGHRATGSQLMSAQCWNT